MITAFDPMEYRKCRMCVPTHRSILLTEHPSVPPDPFAAPRSISPSPIVHPDPVKPHAENKVVSNPFSLGTDTRQLSATQLQSLFDIKNKWFETYQNARLILDDMSKSKETTIKLVYSKEYDISKSKIHWDEKICAPYIVQQTEGFNLMRNIHKNQQKESVRAILSKVILFTQYQSETKFDSTRYRRNCSQMIRKCLFDSDLAKKEGYFLTTHNSEELDIRQETTDSFNVKPPKYNIKWFPCMDSVENAIKDFEVISTTKFVSYGKHCHELSKTPIQFDETKTPYIVVNKKELVCQHGKDYKKGNNDNSLKQIPEHLLDHPRTFRKNKSLQCSKKQNCTAKISITEVLKFPQYQNSTLSAFDIKLLRNKIQAKNDKTLVKETSWCVKFPDADAHSGHVLGQAAGILQKVDQKLITKIDEMVENGIYNVQEIKRGLNLYVIHELFKNEEPPTSSNRRFFPLKKDIQNHYYKSFTQRRLAKIDQTNIQLLVNQWKEEANKDDNFFFRPYIAGSNTTPKFANNADESAPIIDCQQALLFVHQFAWQRRLLLRYGQDICLLDATYKTSKYALPLFFLCVKTNVGYQVVASFITQNERQTDIEEALKILKAWCPNWSPSFFMTDKCDAEINAIESSFLDCRVLICDFHREQAWERWVKRTENNVGDTKDKVLQLIRAVAQAEDESSFIKALQNLRSSEIWKNNVKFQRYFENMWLKEKERWVYLYRADKVNVLIRTNNGVERQNRVLKECHMRFRTDKSLSGLVTILHKEFLPEGKQRYEEKNLRASGAYRKYSENVPLYLRNRPTAFVKFCMQRIAESTSVSVKKILRNGSIFTVESSSTNKKYTVQFGSIQEFPKCTCPDFRQNCLPCKHMFAIFNAYDDVSWHTLPQWYSNSVYLTLDPTIVGQIETKENSTESCNVTTVSKTAIGFNYSIEDKSSTSYSENTTDDKPNPKTIKSIVDQLTEIKNLAYDATSENTLKEVKNNLATVIEALTKSCKFDTGIRVSQKDVSVKKRRISTPCRDETKIHVKPRRLSLKVKRKCPSGIPCHDELPRKQPKPNNFASRCGAHANTMQKLNQVVTLCPKETIQNKLSLNHDQNLDNTLLLPPPNKELHHSKQKNTQRKITPNLNIVPHHHVDHTFLKNGPHSLSLLQIKSIEQHISRGELLVLLSHDHSFRAGWLYDEVVNGFLWQLSSSQSNILYVSSMVALVLQQKGSIKRLWSQISISNKTWIFVPWNPSGRHWILLAINIEKRLLLYLDPVQMVCTQTSMSVRSAFAFINDLIRQKFGFSLTSVESVPRTLQQDTDSCGVLVCMYAKWLASNKSLVQSGSVFEYRQQVYDSVVGACLKGKLRSNKCKLCDDPTKVHWVQCSRCPQWFHSTCVGMTQEQAANENYFVCQDKFPLEN